MKREPADRDVIVDMLETAAQKLRAAQRAFDDNDAADCASRAYYAAYHAISAVLAHAGLVFSTHGQTLGAFNREFVHTGEFPPGTFPSKIANEATTRSARH